MHVSAAGCCGPAVCASREVAVSKAIQLLDSVVLRMVPIPALKKWTKVAPVVASICVMMCFGKVVRQAMEKKLGVRKSEGGFDSDVSEGQNCRRSKRRT